MVLSYVFIYFLRAYGNVICCYFYGCYSLENQKNLTAFLYKTISCVFVHISILHKRLLTWSPTSNKLNEQPINQEECGMSH
jgi:hypothetical protein